MATEARTYVVQGDTGSSPIVLLRESNGSPVDCSGAIVNMLFRKKGTVAPVEVVPCTPIPGLRQTDGSIIVNGYESPGSGGLVKILWPVGVLDEAGEYEGEMELVFFDDTVRSLYNTYPFTVRAEFGSAVLPVVEYLSPDGVDILSDEQGALIVL